MQNSRGEERRCEKEKRKEGKKEKNAQADATSSYLCQDPYQKTQFARPDLVPKSPKSHPPSAFTVQLELDNDRNVERRAEVECNGEVISVVLSDISPLTIDSREPRAQSWNRYVPFHDNNS